VEEGDLFVAIRGDTSDGHEFLTDALRRGARAVLVENELPVDLPVPTIQVEDSRRALAELAAEWYGNPAGSLALIGISGTVGKTSVLAMLEAILLENGVRVGTVGSLGVRLDGVPIRETGYTAPDALLLHESLAQLRDSGCELAVMEVTSHALVQSRVHGLLFDVEVFTNLLPLEHQEYHGSFEGYVEAKVGFFDHLAEGAPLVYSADDPTVRAIVDELDLRSVSCGTAPRADVRIGSLTVRSTGTSLNLSLERGLPDRSETATSPQNIEIDLRLLGRSNVQNAALAATAALLLGIGPGTIRRALAGFPPPRRRVEMIHAGEFMVIDDTVGHPESISALFEAVRALNPRRVHVAFAVRGSRGPEINRHTAEAIAIWADQVPPATLILTRSEEAVDDKNRVLPEESAAFADTLTERGIPFEEVNRLDDAIQAVLDAAESGDLVLLLGAQGMDRGAEMARTWLARQGMMQRSGGVS
jgi:UDP-N-acetylmuramoyl-L-alanyl-D-glutamate--2,6-diaminopimelate ligase